MILKTSLHIHTNEDKKDGHMIAYNVYQLIDEAKQSGFQVLGFTPHKKFVFKEKYAEYALKQGILLIPGIELNLGRVSGKHVIILNCDKSIEKVKNFKQLIAYKKEHPEIFIISPHPTYSRIISIGARNLRKYISLFDAIEHSWAYSFRINKNKKAEQIAQENKKPFIATSDVHVLNRLNMDYCMIETDDFSIEGIFKAICRNNFENVTFPKKYLDLLIYITGTVVKYGYKYVQKKILRLGRQEFIAIRTGESLNEK